MTGKTLAQLLEKYLLQCSNFRVIHISLLWMGQADDESWTFENKFRNLMGGTAWSRFVRECNYIKTILIIDEIQVLYCPKDSHNPPRHGGHAFWNILWRANANVADIEVDVTEWSFPSEDLGELVDGGADENMIHQRQVGPFGDFF